MNGDPVPRQQLNGNVGVSIGRFGSIGVAYAGVDLVGVPNPASLPSLPGVPGVGNIPGPDNLYAAPTGHSHVLSASYSVQVHRMALYVTDFHDFTNNGANSFTSNGGNGFTGSGGNSLNNGGNNGSNGVMVGLTIPFGRRSSVSVGLDSEGGYGQLQAQQSVVTIGDWGYQAYVSAGDPTHEFAQALYKSPRSLISAGIDQTGGQMSVNLESQGAVSLFDGGVFASNTVNDSFAVVDTGGLANVHVLQENRDVGSTDSKGRLLVPDLRAFDMNRIAIEPTDVPLDTTLSLTAREVRPQDRSGVVVRFPVKISHAALLRLVDEAGALVPLGSTVTLRATGVIVPVGYDGEAYVQDLSLRNEIAVERPDGQRCGAAFSYKPVPGQIPTIGPLACREQRP